MSVCSKNDKWWTPSLIARDPQDWPLATTFRDVHVRNDFINEKTLPLILWLENLINKHL